MRQELTMSHFTRRNLLKAGLLATSGTLAGASVPCAANADGRPANSGQAFRPAWESLRQHVTPQWLREGKFGIYTHWGVYAVPAMGPNCTWYAHNFYMNPGGWERKHQEATYGPLTKFGYKDFIPMFKAEKFDPDAWADLFVKSGARFAGPVAEHHDGFSMWDTKWSEWNSAKMGPRRDVVGELSKSIKARGMKFVTAFHHAENWFYFPTWDKRYDCSDPRYSGLYGMNTRHEQQPNKAFLDRWKGKVVEVIDKYGPDMLWFDYGLELVAECYKKELLAYYFNKAAAERQEVAVTYKWHHLPPVVGVNDLELGQEADMTYHEWITDSSVDNGSGWGYVKGLGFKSVENLVTNLVDRVAKNGYLLLNIGPKADGTFPDEAQERLLGLGKWLAVNGEAIYGTTPWFTPGEGPTKLSGNGAFNEKNDLRFTPQDIRFTAKDNVLYATLLAWPGEKALIKSFAPHDTWVGLYPTEIASVTMLGDGKDLTWTMAPQGLVVTMPDRKPCEHAFVLKIVRKPPF
jgi:alpha-L-fucosidase